MKLVILGNGGYSKTLQDVAEQLGYDILAVLDDKDEHHPLSCFSTYLSNTTNTTEEDTVEFAVAFGNNEFRLSWIDKLQSAGAKLATLIHPTAYISPRASIAPGVVILPHAIINTNTTINRGCIINIGSMVDHDVILEEGVHLAPGAIVKEENRVARCMKIDSGEVIAARQWPV